MQAGLGPALGPNVGIRRGIRCRRRVAHSRQFAFAVSGYKTVAGKGFAAASRLLGWFAARAAGGLRLCSEEQDMCELFAVSSARAARVRLRFAEFATHGAPLQALTGSAGNPDGWGAAYFDGIDAHVLREPVPAVRSVFARVLEDHDFHSPLVLAHVRRASRGPVALANTQPFVRELGARVHVFAHNGDLAGFETLVPASTDWAAPARPVGQTDSEAAFCHLLRMLQPLWRDPASPPSEQARLQVVEEFAAGMRELGPANFLYSDGQCLFAHADRRRHADGVIREPGLHLWLRRAATRHDHDVAGLQLRGQHHEAHPLALLASVPLGGGDWRALPRGTVVGVAAGERFA